MGCFSMLQEILERLERQIPGNFAERTRIINHHLTTTLDYSRLKEVDRPTIDYSDPAVRMAYLYKYVTAHAQLVGQRVLSSDLLWNVVKDDCFITCLGGGPGSELLGISLAISEREVDGPTARHAVLLDREFNWSYDWADLAGQFRLPLSYAALPFDVVDATSWRRARNVFERPDLVTAVFFLSEVYSAREQARACLEHLAYFMKPGAVFFYLDNFGEGFTTWWEPLFLNRGFRLMECNDVYRWPMPRTEQLSDLGNYAGRFAHQPTLHRSVAWRILRKDST